MRRGGTTTNCQLEEVGAPSDHLLAQSDLVLVAAVQGGERHAFGELVRRYQLKLRRTIYRMVNSVETAEDLVQDAFLKAYRRLDQFDMTKRFGPWLFQIAINGTIDWLRRQRRCQRISLQRLHRESADFDIIEPDPRPIDELNQEVRFVLGKLPLEYRVVLALRDLENFSCEEVALIIGRQEATVRWRLAKAREMFRCRWLQRENHRNP